MLGIPQFKEKNKENETFQKQSAMLEEVVISYGFHINILQGSEQIVGSRIENEVDKIKICTFIIKEP